VSLSRVGSVQMCDRKIGDEWCRFNEFGELVESWKVGEKREPERELSSTALQKLFTRDATRMLDNNKS
jgi:hypothetical protein